MKEDLTLAILKVLSILRPRQPLEKLHPVLPSVSVQTSPMKISPCPIDADLTAAAAATSLNSFPHMLHSDGKGEGRAAAVRDFLDVLPLELLWERYFLASAVHRPTQTPFADIRYGSHTFPPPLSAADNGPVGFIRTGEDRPPGVGCCGGGGA